MHELPTKGPWIALASVLVIGSMPWLVCPRLGRWRSERGAAASLAELRGCLGGGDAIDDASLRRRAIGASLVEDVAGEAWPQRCRPPAAQLEVSFSELERTAARCDDACCPEDTRCQQVGYLRSVLARVRTSLTSHRFHDGLVAALFDQAAELGLKGEPVQGSPPAAARALVTLPPSGLLGRQGFDRLHGDTTPGGGARLLFWQGEHVTECELGASATCREPHPNDAAVDGGPGPELPSCTLTGGERATWQTGPDDALTVSFGVEEASVSHDAHVGSTHFGVACDGPAVVASYIDKLSEEPIAELRPTLRAAPVRGRYRVGRLRCRRSGCDAAHADIELTRHRMDSRYLVTSLGDTALVLWRAPHGEVRMRRGRLDQLAAAPDRWLLEGDEHGGARWERNAGLWVRDGVAYLVIERSDEAATVHVVRFDASGQVGVVDLARNPN